MFMTAEALRLSLSIWIIANARFRCSSTMCRMFKGLCRFMDYIKPGPEDVLVVTTDGSHIPGSAASGWGITFAARNRNDPQHEVFVGCLWGSLHPLAHLFEDGIKSMGAYLAEVVGLMWAAIALLQMRWHRPVEVRCDNLSALNGVAGTADMKPHPVCRAARALHMCLLCVLQANLTYHHVSGHSGDQANELADALAEFSITHPSGCGGFGLDFEAWFQSQGDAFAWLPHLFWNQQFPSSGPEMREGVLSLDHHVPNLTCHPDAAMGPSFEAPRFMMVRLLVRHMSVLTYKF